MLWAPLRKFHDVASPRVTPEEQPLPARLHGTQGSEDACSGILGQENPKETWCARAVDTAVPASLSPAVCFLCSSNRSAELMEELADSRSSRALLSY